MRTCGTRNERDESGEQEGTGVTDSARAGRRLLLVHAHPDDETIMTGGTIAWYLPRARRCWW